jgi:hypothetical protein
VRKELKMTRKQIIKNIGNPNLNLYAGKGYFYFVYTDNNIIYEDHSVYTMRLHNMTMQQWINEGNYFLNKMGVK